MNLCLYTKSDLAIPNFNVTQMPPIKCNREILFEEFQYGHCDSLLGFLDNCFSNFESSCGVVAKVEYRNRMFLFLFAFLNSCCRDA